MAWQDRLREAACKFPSGLRVTFLYEDVRREVDKKGTAFEFPDVDGTNIQQTGRSGRQFPMRIFFSGDNYDLEADAFYDGLLDNGTVKLEHPRYGTVDVVPFGKIVQRDDLKTAGNQAVIELVFWETIGLIYPSSQTDPGAAVLAGVSEFNEAISNEFNDALDTDTAVERVTLKNSYTRLLSIAESTLRPIADAQEDVAKQFDAAYDSINEGIDVLISDPLTLAFQTSIMLQSPARALTAIQNRLNAYGNLIDSLTTGDNAIADPSSVSVPIFSSATFTKDSRVNNEFRTKDLFTSTFVTGSVVSVVNNQFTTKTEALEAAVSILEKLDQVEQWREANFSALSEVDEGVSYQQLQEVVALTAGFLVEISFTLKQERVITLDRDRTIIDLVAELYGEVNNQLDFFITSNDLSGSEILELPKGRQIVYYV